MIILLSIQDQSESSFLEKDNNIVMNSIELKEFRKPANFILARQQGDIFSKEKIGYVYQHIRT